MCNKRTVYQSILNFILIDNFIIIPTSLISAKDKFYNRELVNNFKDLT